MKSVEGNIPYLSFIIPLLNEAKSLDTLYEKIVHVLKPYDYNYELIFVDDGSTDASFKTIQEIREKDPSVKIIRFRKNFGKSAALNQGFRFAKGDIIFTLDADLQDDPKEIPRFISKINEGFDLVSGWKQSRKDSVLMKNLPSKLFNFAVGHIVGLKIHDYNCGFKAYRKQLAKNLSLYGDLHRYIPALAFSQGYKVTEIPVEHHARRHGKSKFGLERFTHGLFDFLTITFLIKFLKRPMHFFGWFGGILSTFGFGVCLYLSVLWFGGESIGNRPLLILGILLILIGMQMLSTGLIAEMIVHSQKRSEEDVIEYISGWGNHEPYEKGLPE
jgi:glycosyltransferase involved in cell wall biosynthesis